MEVLPISAAESPSASHFSAKCSFGLVLTNFAVGFWVIIQDFKVQKTHKHKSHIIAM